jgi:hypothetical protein
VRIRERHGARFTRNARFSVTPAGRLRLPKIGDIEVRWSRDLPSEPSSVTVILDAAGRYFASFVVDADSPLSPADAEVGIDLGLTHFAVLSDGRKVASPKRRDRRGSPPSRAEWKPIHQGSADVTYRVRAGECDCGTILWECKRAANWSGTCIGKLADDVRKARAAFGGR